MPADDRLLLRVPDAARLLDISPDLCYELIRRRELPHVRFGRVIRVPRFGLEAWIARQAGLPMDAAPDRQPVAIPQGQRH